MGPSEEISRRIARPSVVFPDTEFAHDTERLALPNRYADPVDRLNVAGETAHYATLYREPDFKVRRLDDHRSIGAYRRRVGPRLRSEQRARVGMLGLREYMLYLPFLDNLSVLHDAHIVGDPADDAEIVSDKEHRHSQSRLKLL